MTVAARNESSSHDDGMGRGEEVGDCRVVTLPLYPNRGGRSGGSAVSGRVLWSVKSCHRIHFEWFKVVQTDLTRQSLSGTQEVGGKTTVAIYSKSLVLDDTAANRGDWSAALSTRNGRLVRDPSWRHGELIFRHPVPRFACRGHHGKKTKGGRGQMYAGDTNLISSILTGVAEPCPADKEGSPLETAAVVPVKHQQPGIGQEIRGCGDVEVTSPISLHGLSPDHLSKTSDTHNRNLRRGLRPLRPEDWCHLQTASKIQTCSLSE